MSTALRSQSALVAVALLLAGCASPEAVPVAAPTASAETGPTRLPTPEESAIPSSRIPAECADLYAAGDAFERAELTPQTTLYDIPMIQRGVANCRAEVEVDGLLANAWLLVSPEGASDITERVRQIGTSTGTSYAWRAEDAGDAAFSRCFPVGDSSGRECSFYVVAGEYSAEFQSHAPSAAGGDSVLDAAVRRLLNGIAEAMGEWDAPAAPRVAATPALVWPSSCTELGDSARAVTGALPFDTSVITGGGPEDAPMLQNLSARATGVMHCRWESTSASLFDVAVVPEAAWALESGALPVNGDPVDIGGADEAWIDTTATEDVTRLTIVARGSGSLVVAHLSSGDAASADSGRSATIDAVEAVLAGPLD